MGTMKVGMICTKCGVSFTRSKARMNNHSLCRKCKFEETYHIKRYTGETALISEKRKNTTKIKYGVDNVAQSKEVIGRASSTKLEKYGYVGHFQKPYVQKQLQETAHTQEAYTKKRATCIGKFGVEHHMKSVEGIRLHKEKVKRKTGYDNPMRDPKVRKKIIDMYGQIGRVKGYTYENLHFDSSWELATFIWMTDHHKKFIYHPPTPFRYIGDDGLDHEGYPDFLIEGKFYEIKGTQFFNENHEPFNMYTQKFWWGKFQAMKDNNIEILEHKDVKPYLEYVKSTYGAGYLKSFKNK